jgi:hypothetical protein
MAKAFHDLNEREILALAISQEEDDGRIYGEFAERLRGAYPATAEALPMSFLSSRQEVIAR